MDWVSSREWAYTFAIVVVAGISLSIPGVRSSIRSLITAIFHPSIIQVSLGAFVSVVLGLLLFKPDEGWNARHIWLSAIWLCFAAMPMVAKVCQAVGKSWSVVGDTVYKAIFPSAVVGFFAHYSFFPLWFEIILISVVLLANFWGMAKAKQDYTDSDVIIEKVNVVTGSVALICLAASLWSIVMSPEKFFSADTASYFFLPFFFWCQRLCIYVGSWCMSPINKFSYGLIFR